MTVLMLPPELATSSPIIAASDVSSSVSSWAMISLSPGLTEMCSLRQERRVSPCLALAHSPAPKNLRSVLSMTISMGPFRGASGARRHPPCAAVGQGSCGLAHQARASLAPSASARSLQSAAVEDAARHQGRGSSQWRDWRSGAGHPVSSGRPRANRRSYPPITRHGHRREAQGRDHSPASSGRDIEPWGCDDAGFRGI